MLLEAFWTTPENNLSLIVYVEVAIRVEGNYRDFIPVEVRLMDKDQIFVAQTCSRQDANLLIRKIAGVHEIFSSEVAELFFIGPNGPDPNLVDK